jgi:hypothetical protein
VRISGGVIWCLLTFISGRTVPLADRRLLHWFYITEGLRCVEIGFKGGETTLLNRGWKARGRTLDQQ